MSNINHYPLVKSFKPIEIFLLIFGYSYNVDYNKFLLILNYSMQSIYLAFSIYLYINSHIVPSYPIFASNTLINITNRVQLFAKIFTFVVLLINNFSYRNHIQNLFRRLYSIDSKFREIKIDFNFYYTQNRRRLFIWIFLFSIISVSLLGFTNIAFASKIELKWSSFCIFITPLITPFMINLQLIFYVNICLQIKFRFDQLNTLLSDGADTLELELSEIAQLHMELNDCIQLINNGWSYASLGIMVVPFTSVTSNVFVLFYFVAYTPDSERIWGRIQIYCLVFWLLYHAVQVLIVIIVCNETTLASQETRILLNRFYTERYQLEYNSDMELVILQFQHQSSQFTAYGFFNIDDRLIFSMISAITTYVVILLQFDAGSDLSNNFTIYAYKS